MAKCESCGAKGLFLKVNSSGICLNCVTKKLAEADKKYEDAAASIENMEKALTPEMQDAMRLEKLIQARRDDVSGLERQVREKEEKLNAVKKQIADCEAQLVVASDSVEMESFALYRPKYAFTTSEEYKRKLDTIRDQQKLMIKNKTAAKFSTNWTVNGSKTEGKKMIGDMVKLFLRAFNNECDMAVNDAKFNNIERCITRILNSFSTINKLGRVNGIEISVDYRNLKLEELTLAYEYQCKKQEEREALRALREQQREEAKLAKEIEAARKEAEKEKKHYQQALDKLRAQSAECKTDEERAAIIEKENEIIGKLDDLTHKMEDIDYRQSNQRAGYVYIISNIGSFGEGVYKIGMTRRLDPMERVYELGDASVPFMFDVHAMIFSDDAPKLEAALHQAFADKRVNGVNTRREYFRVSLDEIKQVVRENHDKTVEFVDVPDAQQYRETLLMQQSGKPA